MLPYKLRSGAVRLLTALPCLLSMPRHQQDEETIMVLLAWSRPDAEEKAEDATAASDGDAAAAEGADGDAPVSKRAAHMKGVTLEEMDAETPLLEGTEFSDPDVAANLRTPLRTSDQALLLLWAADVKDHNPMVRHPPATHPCGRLVGYVGCALNNPAR